MMLELLRTRRSIRRYRDQPLDPATIELLTEAILRSPSSRGLDPWQFVLVDDRQRLERLARAKAHGSSFLRHAALAIVVCGDEARSDVWVEDCSIAATVAHFTAHSLGLGSCWIQIRKRGHAEGQTAEQFVAAELGIPTGLRVEAIVAIGHPDATKPGHPRESLDFGKLHKNQFGGA